MRLNAERWRALLPHLDRALDLTAAERAAWLAAMRQEDGALAEDLGLLLSKHAELDEEGFLERSPPSPVPAPSTLAGQTLGAYTLTAQIGQGGMGSVWQAQRSDGRFQGTAAVKLLNASLVGRNGEARFRREGSILASLHHPHIAQLMDAGVSPQGQPYIVLELVGGQRIDAYCDRRSLDVEARLRLFLDVLAAVSHAHAHLVVHRDLKPSNVLVDVEGRVKLLDFGIAKLVEGELDTVAALTRDGEAPLTPDYAAPEQLTASGVTTATDVYALGVLLYVLLTGRHPWREGAHSPADLVRAVVDTEPMRPSDAAAGGERADERATERASTPRRLQGLLRGDLDNIVAKALKKRPEERYSSAEAMAEDLRRFLAHEPVSARADSLRYRAVKFVRRNRTAVALSAVALLALVAGVAGTVSQALRARAQAARADREARAAEEQRDFALRQLSRAEAINDLNSFLLSEAAPQGQPFTVGDLLARAEAIVEQGEDPDGNRVELMVSIGHQYDRQDEVDKARRVLERAYELSRASPDPTTRAKAACALAAALATTSEKDRAEQLFQGGLAELRPQPTYALHRYFCLTLGSRVAGQRGDNAVAVERAEAAVRVARETPFASAQVSHGAQMTLGSAYQRVGRFREAAAAFEEGYRQLSSTGRGETQSAATLLGNWGLALKNLGQPLKAEPLLRRAIEISSAAGHAESVTAQKLVNIGQTLQDLHRFAEARTYAERADAQARRSGQEQALVLALTLRADVYRELGEVRRAAAMVAELATLLDRVNRPGHVTFAVLATQRSNQAKAEGDLATAIVEADRAIALAEAAKAGSVFLPGAHMRRALIALDMGRAERALTDVDIALRTYEERSGPGALSSQLGRAHLERGRALRALGRPAEAGAEFTTALEHLEPSLGSEHPWTSRARELASASSGPGR